VKVIVATTWPQKKHNTLYKRCFSPRAKGTSVKRDVLSNRPTCSIDTSANVACQYLLDLSPQQRLKRMFHTRSFLLQ
jgi:hypothetical protein